MRQPKYDVFPTWAGDVDWSCCRVMFRSITDESEVDSLVSLSVKRDSSIRWVTGLLDRGESRLEWCRSARSDDGELLAAHVFDAPRSSSTPA